MDDPLIPPKFSSTMKTSPYEFKQDGKTHWLVDVLCDYTKCTRHVGNKCCADLPTNQPLPKKYFGVISQDIMHEPVHLVGGQGKGLYDREFIEKYINENKVDPLTNLALQDLRTRTNAVFMEEIKQWKKRHLIVKIWGKAGE